MDVTCDLLCWITTILACMLVGLKSLVISLDYRSYMGSSARIWSFRWLFLYLCSYNLDGYVTSSVPISQRPTSVATLQVSIPVSFVILWLLRSLALYYWNIWVKCCRPSCSNFEPSRRPSWLSGRLSGPSGSPSVRGYELWRPNKKVCSSSCNNLGSNKVDRSHYTCLHHSHHQSTPVSMFYFLCSCLVSNLEMAFEPDLLMCGPSCRVCWCVGLRARNVVVGLRADVFLVGFGNLPVQGRCCWNFQLFFKTPYIFILSLTCNLFFFCAASIGRGVELVQRVTGIARRAIRTRTVAGIARWGIVVVSRLRSSFYVLNLWTWNLWTLDLWFVIYRGFRTNLVVCYI
jgi:hypothetical protein